MLVIQFTCDTVAGGVICSSITDTSLKGQKFALNSCKVHKKDSFCCLDRDSSMTEAVYFDTSEARDKRNGVLSPAEGMM